ncbi:hypothetical protein FZEAL_1020 [Fusarium zealandicum]|uniref:Uncharacterized protein n=1 Tax=Fusarium zealandicum TaxID=1053134 RepID=A0A8H4UU20_9HYPO|nr:hypothetical protein FZEAL_1020 [Fusarium zealandicum]
MASISVNLPGRPSAWTLDQPTFSIQTEATFASPGFDSPEFSSAAFTSADCSSTGFQKVSESVVAKPDVSLTDASIPRDDVMVRFYPTAIVKIESRFANKQTGHAIWKIGTGWLVRPDLIVTGGDVVYDAEYQLGAATQVKCYVGYHGAASSEIQPRYGQRVTFSADWIDGNEKRSRDIAFVQVAEPFAVETSSYKPDSVKAPEPELVPVQGEFKINSGTFVGFLSDQVPSIDQPTTSAPAEPFAVETSSYKPDSVKAPEPELVPAQGEFKINSCTFVGCLSDQVSSIDQPTTSAPAEPDHGFVEVTNAPEEADPFYEVLKTVSQIDTKTLVIESSMIDDVGQFVSVAAGSLLHYVAGAEKISSGKATKLAGVSERALLAEASLQAIFATEQSAELDEIIAIMKKNWTANAHQVDKVADLLAPYLAEAARQIVEYHQEDDIEQLNGSKKLKRRNLAIRDLSATEKSKPFFKGLLGPSLPLAGREDVFSSLGPVLRAAVSAFEQQLVSQTGKAAIEERVPMLLKKYQGAAPTAGDIQATRVLLQRAIMADAAYQALEGLPQATLSALTLIPLDSGTLDSENIFDFLKRVIQRVGPVCLQDAKQAIHKFTPLLVDPSAKAPKPVAPVLTQPASGKIALRDFLTRKQGSVKVNSVIIDEFDMS